MHRLGMAHVLGNIPVIGARYRFGDWPVDGSTDTLMKTSSGSTGEQHFTRYGSQSRHISDLSDLDRNWFLLLGGQDGWINSSTFMDQVEPWLEGRYIQVPMRPESARARPGQAMTLTP
jgi:penicillin amidase